MTLNLCAGTTLRTPIQEPEYQRQGSSFPSLDIATKPSLKLCKTLLSAAILNYPSPMLLGYGQEGDIDRPGADVVRNTLKLLDRKDSYEVDLVLVVDECM